MTAFFAYTAVPNPGLHIWREGTSLKRYLRPVSPPGDSGWVEFQSELHESMAEPVRFMLFSFDEDGSPGSFESDDFQRELPRLTSGHFPDAVWFTHGASRVVLQNPRAHHQASLTVHLISQSRFRPSE